MIDIPELRRLYRVTRVDFWIAVAAIIGVLSAGVLAGVVVGVVLSLVWLIYVATRPAMPLLGREPGHAGLPRSDENPTMRPIDGLVVLRLDGGLFFATADALENRVRGLVDDEEPRALVLDLEGVNFVDSQGAAKLAEIHDFLVAGGVTFRVARLKPQVLAVLERGRRRRPDRSRSHSRQRPPRRGGGDQLTAVTTRRESNARATARRRCRSRTTCTTRGAPRPARAAPARPGDTSGGSLGRSAGRPAAARCRTSV